MNKRRRMCNSAGLYKKDGVHDVSERVMDMYALLDEVGKVAQSETYK